MDVRLQAKLLRAIQERVIDRVGGTRPVPVDIRIIATSNRNLAEAVREGTFREDLLFRLNVVNLKIPPLRERPADVHRARRVSSSRNTPTPTACRCGRCRPRRARRSRCNRWPGNVRELENTMHRAVLLATRRRRSASTASCTPDGARLDQAARLAPRWRMPRSPPRQVTRALVGRTVADVERDLILETLKHCLGNRTHAANILGISIRTLRNKLNEYAADGVPVPPPGGGEISGAA